MALHPIRIDFIGEPPAAGVEAVATRRMRGIEVRFPAVLEWHARIEAAPAPQDRYAARVSARMAGGDTLGAHGGGHDAFAALRVAFNALEQELEADQEGARTRAAEWLAAVRLRMRARPEFR